MRRPSYCSIPIQIATNGSERSEHSGRVIERFGKREAKVYTIASSTMSTTSVSTTPSITNILASIGQGTDYTQRIGRRIRVKRIFFHGQVLGGQANSVADDPYNVFRISVVMAKPAFNTATWGVNTPIDPRYGPCDGLIRVLHDSTHVMQAPAKDSTGYIASAKEFEFDLPVEIPVEYATSSTAAPA